MSKITIDQFCAQWRNGNYRMLGSKLFYNAQDFVTAAGEYAKQQFQSSFERGGFNGSKWPAHTSKWGKKFTHPTMIDTGTLSRSIKGERGRSLEFGKLHGKGGFRRTTHYDIWTTEVSSYIRGKRGKKRGKYKNYAAVHNTDPKFGLYTVNQYSSRRPVHRQFIGFSPNIEDHINGLVDMIFEGFPK